MLGPPTEITKEGEGGGRDVMAVLTTMLIDRPAPILLLVAGEPVESPGDGFLAFLGATRNGFTYCVKKKGNKKLKIMFGLRVVFSKSNYSCYFLCVFE